MEGEDRNIRVGEPELLQKEQRFKAEGLKGIKCVYPTISESQLNFKQVNGKILYIYLDTRKSNQKYKNISFEECEKCAKCLPVSWIRRLSKMVDEIKDAQYGAMSIIYCMRKTYFQRTKIYYETIPMLLSREKGREWQNTRRREGGTWNEMEFHSQYYNKFKIPIYKLINGEFSWKKEDIIRYEEVDLVTFIDHYDPNAGIFIESKKMENLPRRDNIPEIYFEHFRQVGIAIWFMNFRLKVKKIELVYHTKDELCRFDITRTAKNSAFFLNIEEWIFNRLVRLHNFIRARIVPPAEKYFLCPKCVFKSDCEKVEREHHE